MNDGTLLSRNGWCSVKAVVTIFIVALAQYSTTHAAHNSNSGDIPAHTTVRNDAIDSIDVQWWDDAHSLLTIDVTFNFSVMVSMVVTEPTRKTHFIQLRTTGTFADSYRDFYSGKEHHAVPKQFRDIIEEIRYEGGRTGKANLVIYTYQPVELSYRQDNHLRKLRVELSLQKNAEGGAAPQP